MAEELGGRVQEIEKSVDGLESQMRAQIARTQSGTRAVLVIGIIIIAIIFIYMTWLSAKVKDLTDPSDLAMMIEVKISEEIPEVLDELEKSLTGSASSNVEYILDDLLERLPLLREQAEEAVGKLVDQFAADLDQKVDDIVAEMLKMKKMELDPLIEAAAAKGETEALEAAFKESLEASIGDRMDEALRDYNAHMTAIERRLDRLMLPDAKLTSEERLEKEVIAAILIFIDDAVKEQLAPAPKTP